VQTTAVKVTLRGWIRHMAKKSPMWYRCRCAIKFKIYSGKYGRFSRSKWGFCSASTGNR
jgi:hypothetical protein